MDDNVISIGGETAEQDQIVLVCGPCGCLSHFINFDQTIECTNCGTLATPEESKWMVNLPDTPADITALEDTGGHIVSKVMGSPVLARKRVIKHIVDWDKSGELCIVVGYDMHGTGSHWLNIVTKEQKEWVVNKLKQLLEFTENANVE